MYHYARITHLPIVVVGLYITIYTARVYTAPSLEEYIYSSKAPSRTALHVVLIGLKLRL